MPQNEEEKELQTPNRVIQLVALSGFASASFNILNIVKNILTLSFNTIKFKK